MRSPAGAQSETPRGEDLFTVGTVAAIMRMLKLPDGRIRLLVQGLSRARLDSILSEEPYLKAKITKLEEPPSEKELPPEHEALLRSVKQNLEKSVALGKTISPEVMVIAATWMTPRAWPTSPPPTSTGTRDAIRSWNPGSGDAFGSSTRACQGDTVLPMQQEISLMRAANGQVSARVSAPSVRAIQQELANAKRSRRVSHYRGVIE